MWQQIGYSDLFCLSKSDLLEAVAEYPDQRQTRGLGENNTVANGTLDEQTAKSCMYAHRIARRHTVDLSVHHTGNADMSYCTQDCDTRTIST